MNSVPNSDSEQCPESRLSWVHKVHMVHTLNPSCAPTMRTQRPGHATRWAGCVVAHRGCIVGHSWPPSQPYRSCAQPNRGRVVAYGSCVAGLCRDTKPCRRPLLVTIQNLYRDPSPCPAHVVARVAFPSVVSQPSRDVSRPKVAPLSHDTISCIATHPLAAKPSCARGARPARRLTLSRACWPCRGVVSWAPCCTLYCPVSRYNLLYRDSN